MSDAIIFGEILLTYPNFELLVAIFLKISHAPFALKNTMKSKK
jgi:hypothetical protein